MPIPEGSCQFILIESALKVKKMALEFFLERFYDKMMKSLKKEMK